MRAWRGKTSRYVQLAVYACSCPARRLRLVCECQLAARLWYNSRTGASFPVADAEGALFTPAGARGGAPLRPHAPTRFSLRQGAAAAAAPPPLSQSATVLEAALHLGAASAVLPHVREGDEHEILSLAQLMWALAVGGARRGLLDGKDLWPGGHHVALGGLDAASEIARQASMASSELDTLPQDAAARLAFVLNVERRRREQAGGGGGGAAAAAAASSGRAEPPFSPPTSTLQCAALAQRAVEVWSGNLLLLQQRTGASSAAGHADKAAPAASSAAGAAPRSGLQARAPAQREPAPAPAQPDPAASASRPARSRSGRHPSASRARPVAWGRARSRAQPSALTGSCAWSVTRASRASARPSLGMQPAATASFSLADSPDHCSPATLLNDVNLSHGAAPNLAGR